MEIEEIIGRLSKEDKVKLVMGHDYWYTADLADQGLKPMMMTDGPSGLRKQTGADDALGMNGSIQAVAYPVSALTAASFDRDLLQELGEYLGQAARNEEVGVLLGPAINMKRTPLGGRNFEYFSEDPYVAGELGAEYVKGVQSQGVGVSVKHFAANNRENQRFTASSNMDERTLREIYLSAFEKIVKEADPVSLMCSYNPINGVPSSENHYLLTEILREEWKFKGFVVSDWGAVDHLVAALKAGLDLTMPGMGEEGEQLLLQALESGDLEEKVLDQAIRRMLPAILRWQKREQQSGKSLEEQHQFAKKLASESIILLKNEGGMLPLDPQEEILVIGELAEKPRFQGGGSSHVNAFRVVSPLEALEQSQRSFTYLPGYYLDGTEDQERNIQAVAAAKTAQKVIIFAGIPEQDESEGFDKDTISLPDSQNQLIAEIAAVCPNVAVVLQSGSAIEMPWNEKVSAVLSTYLAGEASGEAVEEILYGKVNPSGKLAETFPLRLEDNPTYATFRADKTKEVYHEGIFIGYRYYDKKKMPVLYPFGHGLSYTKFDYSHLTLTQVGDELKVELDVENVGEMEGKEVVQVYVSNQVSAVEKPLRALHQFTKVQLMPNEKKHLVLMLNQRSFSWYNETTKAFQTDTGEYMIEVGSSSRDIRLQQKINMDYGEKVPAPLTSNTYLAEVVTNASLRPALEQSGLAQAIDQMMQIPGLDRVLENMPLRTLMMFGLPQKAVQAFITIANEGRS